MKIFTSIVSCCFSFDTKTLEVKLLNCHILHHYENPISLWKFCWLLQLVSVIGKSSRELWTLPGKSYSSFHNTFLLVFHVWIETEIIKHSNLILFSRKISRKVCIVWECRSTTCWLLWIHKNQTIRIVFNTIFTM